MSHHDDLDRVDRVDTVDEVDTLNIMIPLKFWFDDKPSLVLPLACVSNSALFESLLTHNKKPYLENEKIQHILLELRKRVVGDDTGTPFKVYLEKLTSKT